MWMWMWMWMCVFVHWCVTIDHACAPSSCCCCPNVSSVSVFEYTLCCLRCPIIAHHFDLHLLAFAAPKLTCLLPAPCSLLPAPCSLLPAPCSLLPAPLNLTQALTTAQCTPSRVPRAPLCGSSPPRTRCLAAPRCLRTAPPCACSFRPLCSSCATRVPTCCLVRDVCRVLWCAAVSCGVAARALSLQVRWLS
jgi:hypothetical protein